MLVVSMKIDLIKVLFLNVQELKLALCLDSIKLQIQREYKVIADYSSHPNFFQQRLVCR